MHSVAMIYRVPATKNSFLGCAMRDVPGMSTATVYDTIEVDHAASVSFYLNKAQKTERQARGRWAIHKLLNAGLW
jgi:hypothetical protein